MDSVPDGRLLFVLPEGKTAADASPAMQAAFKAAAEEKMEPSWATARVCLGRKRCDPTEVFVCDPFAGAAFEHLRQIQARVVGPLCVSMAIRTQVALPRQAEPVYSLAFHNLVLTSSALASGERERLKTLVELMGGSLVAPLTSRVTHVVAGVSTLGCLWKKHAHSGILHVWAPGRRCWKQASLGPSPPVR